MAEGRESAPNAATAGRDGVGAGFDQVIIDGVDMAVETVPCQSRSSLMYEASLIRNIDKYLRLEGMRVFVVSDGEDAAPIDATEHMGTKVGLLKSILFLERECPDMRMFQMFGSLRGALDMAISHGRGMPAVSVVVPRMVPPDVRHGIAKDVLKGVEMAQLL